MSDYWGKTSPRWVMPARLLDLADKLAREAAGLSGRLAPESAAGLRSLLMSSDAKSVRRSEVQQQIGDGPGFMGQDADYRHRIAEVLRLHCTSLLTAVAPVRVASIGRTREKLYALDLKPDLWQLGQATSKALAVFELEFRTQLSGNEQATAADEFRMLEIMLSACICQVQRTLEAFLPSVLRERTFNAFRCSKQILDARIDIKTAPAVLCVFI